MAYYSVFMVSAFMISVNGFNPDYLDLFVGDPSAFAEDRGVRDQPIYGCAPHRPRGICVDQKDTLGFWYWLMVGPRDPGREPLHNLMGHHLGLGWIKSEKKFATTWSIQSRVLSKPDKPCFQVYSHELVSSQGETWSDYWETTNVPDKREESHFYNYVWLHLDDLFGIRFFCRTGNFTTSGLCSKPFFYAITRKPPTEITFAERSVIRATLSDILRTYCLGLDDMTHVTWQDELGTCSWKNRPQKWKNAVESSRESPKCCKEEQCSSPSPFWSHPQRVPTFG